MNRRENKLLGDAIGLDNAEIFIRLLLEGRSLNEIVSLMPEIFLSRGSVSGTIFRHKAEVEMRKNTYISEHGQVEKLGRSKPFIGVQKWKNRKSKERKIIDEAMREWKPTSGFNQNAFVAMKLNKSRISDGVRRSISADEVAVLLKKP